MLSLRSAPTSLVTAFALVLAFFSSPLEAASRALIVTGLAGSSENSEEFHRLAIETKRLLAERGIPMENIVVAEGKVTRENVLKAMGEAGTADEEFWLVLYGHAGRSQGDMPAFQVSGPRLTAEDLKQALEAIPARQYVFIGTNESGAFLPVLQSPRRTVVSATKMGAEIDQPRFPAAWIEAFSENPKGSFSWIAARAAALVSEIYKSASLAQIEHARLADPVTGTILEPPFGVNLEAKPETVSRPGEGSAPSSDVADIKVKMIDPNAVWENQPATEKTKKLIADARALPNPDQHSAVMLEQQLGLTVEDDRTTDRRQFWRVYLTREDALGEWANAFLPQSPPVVTTKLEVARVIQPDGSAIVFNPAKLPAATDCTSGVCGAMAMVYLPKARAGCIVEIGYRVRQILNASLPEVTESIDVQREIPVLATLIEVKVPAKKPHHVALKNAETKPEESEEHGRKIYRWTLGPLSAGETLWGDPPRSQWLTWLGISSLPSWDDFALWYRRIANGSDAIDDTVRKTARDLTAGAETREEKIKRLFEFVSALRYVAVEIGIQGFRPRTPSQVLSNRFGDCKDKANLLIALLRSSGIEADFVLLNRGGATDVSFPSWQFNHAMCFVPGDGRNADLWLDSTDGITPFGFVPPGDAGRQALVFSKDKAGFKTVGGANDMSLLADAWDLQQDAAGRWSGTFQRTAQGLAEYQLRQAFHGQPPAQRRSGIYQIIGNLWPDCDPSKATVSDVSSLNEAIKVGAQVASDRTVLPLPDFPWAKGFSDPDRDRPLQINDGQPFTTRQTLRLTYAGAVPQPLPAPVQLAAAGQSLSVTWKQIDEHTLERTALVEVKQPVVPPAGYTELRKALRAWNAAVAAR